MLYMYSFMRKDENHIEDVAINTLLTSNLDDFKIRKLYFAYSCI